VSFDRPWALVALLALPLLVWLYVLAQRRRMRYSIRFTNLAVLAPLVQRRSWRRLVPAVLALLALAALTAATARPHVRGLVAHDRATVVLVLDVSGSMESKDVKPTRIGAAQDAIRRFLDKAPRRLRVGLIVFAGFPQVAAPPTTNHELVRQSLDSLGQYSSFGGTAIGDAIAEAVVLGRQTLAADEEAVEPDTARRLVSILFLSDGAQRQGVLQPLDGAGRAKAAGMPVYTIALGTPNGTITRNFSGPFGGGGPRTIAVPPDPETLKAIADTTGGEFFNATSSDALQSAYEKLGSKLGRKPADKEITYAFLAAAAALLTGAGVLSLLWSPRLP
jgi:Ca-activated chloride channel family protein